MIVEYHRPDTLAEAMKLLARQAPKTVPLGGGTRLARHDQKTPIAVVDLQNLIMNEVLQEGNFATIGAMARVPDFTAEFGVMQRLRKLGETEFPLNQRNRASMGGLLAAGDGRSLLLTALLALDGLTTWLPGEKTFSLGDYLPVRRDWTGGSLIGSIRIPLACDLWVESVARTPVDRPVLIVAICEWPTGRTRVAVGGFGDAPVLAFDGSGTQGVVEAVSSALAHADDPWASAEYRSEAGAALADHMLQRRSER